jgi:hypothetical protein
VDGQGNFIGKFEQHAFSLENKPRAKSLFAAHSVGRKRIRVKIKTSQAPQIVS